jgi:hypothetical protein
VKGDNSLHGVSLSDKSTKATNAVTIRDQRRATGSVKGSLSVRSERALVLVPLEVVSEVVEGVGSSKDRLGTNGRNGVQVINLIR